MSSTLGEKLRQARDERGLTISEIAEQTRISALYLAGIENDDYRTLPGGIFNKGFVKSFAKTVGVDEQEALQDYALLVANQDNQIVDDPKTYRSEVLTDDRGSSSNLPTIIFAVIILGLMTAGVLALVNYLQKESSPVNTAIVSNINANTAANINLANTNTATTSTAPTMANLKVEFKALRTPISLRSTVDGKTGSDLINADASKILEPKQSLRLSYAKSLAQNVEIIINGKTIKLPTGNPNRNAIDFEINNDNLKQIWESGQINPGLTAPPR